MRNRRLTLLGRWCRGAVSLLLTFAVLAAALAVSPAPAYAGIGDLTQLDYRWYQNADAQEPTTALAAENTAITGVADAQTIRLRMNVDNASTNLPSGTTFKLQYSTSTGGPWTDVGGIGSGAIWRGYDNPTPADGDGLWSNLLSSSSPSDKQTYEEENNATSPGIKKNKAGEWDWVVQSNGAAASTTYYFQMVLGDGTALAGYTNYPQLTTEVPTPQLSQEDYRWYQNADAVQPTTALAAENTAISNTTDTTVYRLRMNVEDSGAELAAGESFKLQYSTSTGGPWTDVGGLASAEIWRGYDNSTPTDGATLSSVLLTSSVVVETYEEANNSAGTPNAIAVGQRGEWDWVVQQNGASQGTTYYFRIVKSDATVLNGYTNYPQLTTAAPALEQDSYRWYQNTDAIQPTTALAAENAAASNVASSDVVRLRVSLTASVEPTAAGESFKLQYSTSTGGPWTDVGGLGSGEIWRGYDNPTPADGASVTANLLSGATILETYEEANSSAATPNTITVGSAAEWDWVIENNGAADSTTYYFRMVYAGGTVLDTYTVYPELATSAGAAVLTQLQYRWYDNVDSGTPTTPLAAEDTFIAGSVQGAVYRLRMNVSNGPVNLPSGTTFKLQYSTSTGGPWTDVGGIGSGVIWRGYDNPSVADGAALGSNLLSSSSAAVKQTYEEENSATSPGIAKNKVGEWDWVVQNNGASSGTTYYFRMVYGAGTALDAYTTYPELATPGVTVSPNNSDSGPPESEVSYTHTVTNTGRSSDTFDITTSSSAGWTVALYQSDGVTPLADTDGDTTPDTGTLAAGAFVDIVVKVTVGWSGLSDTTTVTATSSLDLGVQGSATDTTTAPPTITIVISDNSAAFGTNLDPEGPASNSGDSVLDYQGSTGNQGSYYVWRASGSGLTVTVKSNQPWDGTVAASENSGSATSMSIASGVLRYAEGSEPASYSACASATAFTTTANPWKSSIAEGIQIYAHYYCLRVDWDDDPGDFISTVTYTVTQV